MSAFHEFLQNLLHEGRVRFREQPEPSGGVSTATSALLGRAYAEYSLEIAGPPIPFDSTLAHAAGEIVQYACWFLVSHQEPEAELERRLIMPHPPSTAAHHLSADLLFRFLPQVYRRSRALYPADLLTKLLAGLLREWPLSGVLSELRDEPAASLDFAGHPGLQLLYAERLAGNAKPAWLPEGSGYEYVELVWQQLDKERSFLDQARRRESISSEKEGRQR